MIAASFTDGSGRATPPHPPENRLRSPLESFFRAVLGVVLRNPDPMIGKDDVRFQLDAWHVALHATLARRDRTIARRRRIPSRGETPIRLLA